MNRREFANLLVPSTGLLLFPLRGNAAVHGQSAPSGTTPETTPHQLTSRGNDGQDSPTVVPASAEAWGEHLSALHPTHRLGFVLEQFLLCKPVCSADIFRIIRQMNREHTHLGWPRQATFDRLRQRIEQPPASIEGLPASHIRQAMSAFLSAFPSTDFGHPPRLGAALYSAIHAVACANYLETTGGRFVPGSAGPVRYIAKANAEAFARLKT